jgi:hypothetical protein
MLYLQDKGLLKKELQHADVAMMNKKPPASRAGRHLDDYDYRGEGQRNPNEVNSPLMQFESMAIVIWPQDWLWTEVSAILDSTLVSAR